MPTPPTIKDCPVCGGTHVAYICPTLLEKKTPDVSPSIESDARARINEALKFTGYEVKCMVGDEIRLRLKPSPPAPKLSYGERAFADEFGHEKPPHWIHSAPQHRIKKVINSGCAMLHVDVMTVVESFSMTSMTTEVMVRKLRALLPPAPKGEQGAPTH